ncbi:MAG: prepilin-type N-terminal cleavage/methylation domain-containing protein [Gallionellaceae bacterium]|nr:prepilin-type N-terminal cleavage/methylation domain-containing protein [Gallionellaceae bacterium]
MTPKNKNIGFSLVEMAIVLFIVALLLGGLLPTLSSQIDLQKSKETQKILVEAQDALLGFAIANGRLPCPAFGINMGLESFASSPPATTAGNANNGICLDFFDGFLPAATLGLAPVDAQGFMVDGWGNRIHYAVANNTVSDVSKTFTRTDGMKMATMGKIAEKELLYVCASATGITNSDCGSAAKLTDKAVAIIYSLGKNGITTGATGDEAANPNPNKPHSDEVFVSHEQTPTFDDIVVWLSPNILFNRMVAAGKLP